MTTFDEYHTDMMKNPEYAQAYKRIQRGQDIKDKFRRSNSWHMGRKRNQSHRPAKRNRNI